MKTNITDLVIVKQELLQEVVEAHNRLNRAIIVMTKKGECTQDVLQGNILEAHHTEITVEQGHHHQVKKYGRALVCMRVNFDLSRLTYKLNVSLLSLRSKNTTTRI